MALVDGLQKAVADATRIHQIDTATQSLFEHFGQLNQRLALKRPAIPVR
ncbi:MAG TPA: hypothetical protein VGJ72_05620 [Polaromonas sp.]|jgi:hypothetical protein